MVTTTIDGLQGLCLKRSKDLRKRAMNDLKMHSACRGYEQA